MTTLPPTRTRIQIASVDDDTVIRAGLPLLFPDFDVVASFEHVEALLAAGPAADLVLLDLVLTGTGRDTPLQGPTAIQPLVALGYPVLIYTNERRREVLASCLAAGARGIVHKAEPLDAVTDAVRRVVAGEAVITQALVGLAEVVERHGALPALTPRQREILSARARGETFRSIAERLFITKKTAEEHMSVVTAKFADYLRDHSPADLERHLGTGPGDLLDGPATNR